MQCFLVLYKEISRRSGGDFHCTKPNVEIIIFFAMMQYVDPQIFTESISLHCNYSTWRNPLNSKTSLDSEFQTVAFTRFFFNGS
jgi:hypothetical protein